MNPIRNVRITIKHNPSGTLYVIDELYEIDKELKEVLDYYKRNPDVSLKLGLSSLRWH